MDMDRLVKAHLKIRDARRDLKKKFDEQDRDLKGKQERLEAEMLRFLNENKIDNSKTAAGTFYRQVDTIPTGSDWEAFYDWVKENDAFDALERRIKKGFINEYMEEHGGETPPGVSVHKQYVIRVRRS